ncbi:uncharacterized protein [Coffea arabica]|uniref:Uncharacterized protein isoform X9 n=1 Tax=Coffea arabica TaxID=13443 RepID=A0ABM4VVQ6_COFAR
MMARLLWMYSVSVTSLSDLYRKGLSGASTQLSYFSSKRRKSKSDVRERFGSHAGNVHLHLGLEDFQRNLMRQSRQVILLNWILKPTMGLPEDIAFFSK